MFVEQFQVCSAPLAALGQECGGSHLFEQPLMVVPLGHSQFADVPSTWNVSPAGQVHVAPESVAVEAPPQPQVPFVRIWSPGQPHTPFTGAAFVPLHRHEAECRSQLDHGGHEVAQLPAPSYVVPGGQQTESPW